MKFIKKTGFFTAFILPVLVIIGFYEGGWWNFIALGFVFIIITSIDYLTGLDTTNVSDQEAKIIGEEVYYRLVTYVWTYVQFIFFGFIGVIALFMIYHMLKKAPQLRREAEQQLERFCREIPLNTHFNRIEAQNERLMEKQGHSQSLCVGCKAALAEKVEFCPHCGYKQ